MKKVNDPETMTRAVRLRRLMSAFLANQTPQERDRTMQMHLAQARGPVRNAMLLRQMTHMIMQARRTQQTSESGNDG